MNQSHLLWQGLQYAAEQWELQVILHKVKGARTHHLLMGKVEDHGSLPTLEPILHNPMIAFKELGTNESKYQS